MNNFFSCFNGTWVMVGQNHHPSLFLEHDILVENFVFIVSLYMFTNFFRGHLYQ